MNVLIDIDPLIRTEHPKDILAEPVIACVNKFDHDSLLDLQEDVSRAHQTGQPVIPVIIDSYGGSPYTCLGMISTLQNSRLPVATILTTKALSAGAILFAFGTEGYRFMDPHASLMLHQVSDRTGGKLEELKVDVKHLEEINASVYKMMAKHLGHSPSYFLDLIHKSNLDIYLTAKEAKRHKIVNHLHVPTMKVRVSVHYQFG